MAVIEGFQFIFLKYVSALGKKMSLKKIHST